MWGAPTSAVGLQADYGATCGSRGGRGGPPPKTTLYACSELGLAPAHERLNRTHMGDAAKTVKNDGFSPGIINLQAKTVILDRFGPLWTGGLRPLPTRFSAGLMTRPFAEFSAIDVARTPASTAGLRAS